MRPTPQQYDEEIAKLICLNREEIKYNWDTANSILFEYLGEQLYFSAVGCIGMIAHWDSIAQGSQQLTDKIRKDAENILDPDFTNWDDFTLAERAEKLKKFKDYQLEYAAIIDNKEIVA